MNKRILDAELRGKRGFLYFFPRKSTPSASYCSFSDMLLEGGFYARGRFIE